MVATSQPVSVPFVVGPPRNLGPPINVGPEGSEQGFDGGPDTSADGLTLYFVSDRRRGFGGSDLWVARRTSATDPWSTPLNLGPRVNSEYMDASPSLSPDGLELYFDSSRPGGLGDWDLWVARRASLSAPWEPPANLGSPFNSVQGDGTPQLSRDGRTLFFSSWRPGGFGKSDIWVMTRRSPAESWQPPVNLGSAINSAHRELGPAPSPDGLLLVFHSDRPGGMGGEDLYVTMRASAASGWTEPANLRTLNTADHDAKAHLSADESTLYFMSTRPGGRGFFDIWEASVPKRLQP